MALQSPDGADAGLPIIVAIQPLPTSASYFCDSHMVFVFLFALLAQTFTGYLSYRAVTLAVANKTMVEVVIYGESARSKYDEGSWINNLMVIFGGPELFSFAKTSTSQISISRSRTAERDAAVLPTPRHNHSATWRFSWLLPTAPPGLTLRHGLAFDAASPASWRAAGTTS